MDTKQAQAAMAMADQVSWLTPIAQNGFRPALGDYTQGCFMVAASGDWVFTGRGGFHRTAAMACLGFETLPAQFYPRLPRRVDEADVASWYP